MLDRLNHRLRNQLQFMVDACQLLGNIQEQGGTTAQQLAAMTADNGTILNSMAEEYDPSPSYDSWPSVTLR